MSNLRIRALQYIADTGELIPIDQIADALNEPVQRLRQAMQDARKDGLVEFLRDEITRQGGYSLTAKGRARVQAGKMTINGKRGEENFANDQAKLAEAVALPEAVDVPAIQPAILPTKAKSKGDTLLDLIIQHGPINGAALARLAREAGCQVESKNVPALLATKIKHGVVVAKQRFSATWYMTPDMVEVDDHRIAIATGHVMSAPDLVQPVEQAEATRYFELSRLIAENHDLRNDVAAANLIFARLCQQLGVASAEDLPDALAAIERQPIQRAPLGYVCILDGDDLTIHADEADARKEAERFVEASGEAGAGAIHVVAILATAELAVQWREAA